ncbi:MAG: type V CRISPR-associated protein Cas12k [Nostoc sp. DedQUE05]|uniref:type V CRISPR-associated protein Cas12k n=1 Tax=Nostoc sp. DedQUE05 TaxID=3075391 RepID=UPI002AD3C46F|nr:type V CRISPR-associated protein Cas12k [Nostoc sp. DedQUE05]MDZ8091102.1 type V CRISPR-associated protein Cas12k [Nostoc sp. DedQUE05]
MSSDRKSKSTVPVHRTIRCHLDASEDILRKVWEEMTQKNTPLILQLLKSVSEQPEFEANKEKGEITKKEIVELRKALTKNPEFEEQSGRLRSSAESFVKEVYSSWLTLYQKRKRQKEGKEYFLENILKSDVELIGESNCDLETIRSKAQEVLTQPEKFLKQLTINDEDVKPTKSARKRVNRNSNNKITTVKQSEDSSYLNNVDKGSLETLTNILYRIHKQTQDILTRCAVAYLIKNHNKISDLEEDIQKLKKRRNDKKFEIKRLEKQIQGNRLPSGRDITGERYSEAFDNLMNQVPKDNKEWEDWIANLSRKISHLPYPIDYLYGDPTWYKNNSGDIIIYFNGWSEYHFKICCNKRQRHFFERFLEDYKAFKESEKGEEKLSGSLITLRSAQLLWQQGEGKGEPWKVHKLALHCTYDARLWTAEGTEEVRKEKTDKAQKRVSKAEENEKLDNIQQLNKDKSSLSRLNNSFNRPGKLIYQGQSNIIVGISFHPIELATVAIVDINTKKVLACNTVKQLLGNAFHLLSRRRRQQVHLSKERKKAQKKDSPCNTSESKLGEYIDKLLANRIVEIAKSYQAGCIILPRLKDMKEIRTSAIQAKAETKIPGDVNAQKLYVKEYNRQIHNWSYNRLQESINSKAAELKISIEFGIQPHYGTLEEQARDLAFYAYQCRINTFGR